jgi:hypothetical protein
MRPRAHTLRYLLDLDGEEIHYDGGFVARFKVTQTEPSEEKPHGISYSLTFHDPRGRRIMGYDNAHGAAKGGRSAKRRAPFDHWHRDISDKGRPYAFVDTEKLISDFFDEITRIIEEQK